MGKVIELPLPLLTVNAFCSEAAADHATISRRLKGANVAPAAKRGKQNLYRLSDLLKVTFVTDADGRVDPDRMDPFRRSAHYKSEMQKLTLEQERGLLIPAIEVEGEMARVAKIVVRFLETLPDVLERDHGLSGAAVSRVQNDIDGLRDELYEALIAPAVTADAVAPTEVAP